MEYGFMGDQMNREDNAVRIFSEGFNCAQAVLESFADRTGLERDQAMRVASCFGGGMRRGEVCGAVTGALMVLGMMGGYTSGTDADAKKRSNERAVDFLDRFSKSQGSIICKELLGDDLSSIAGMEKLVRSGAFVTECPKYVAEAVRILEEMLSKEQ